MSSFTVTGERLTTEGAWEAFEDTFTGATKAEARWKARRRYALGTPDAKLEAEPPNLERLRVEVADPGLPRDVRRTAAQEREYDRLVQTVRITAVEEVGE